MAKANNGLVRVFHCADRKLLLGKTICMLALEAHWLCVTPFEGVWLPFSVDQPPPLNLFTNIGLGNRHSFTAVTLRVRFRHLGVG